MCEHLLDAKHCAKCYTHILFNSHKNLMDKVTVVRTSMRCCAPERGGMGNSSQAQGINVNKGRNRQDVPCLSIGSPRSKIGIMWKLHPLLSFMSSPTRTPAWSCISLLQADTFEGISSPLGQPGPDQAPQDMFHRLYFHSFLAFSPPALPNP